ncbi:hypothetical protein QJS10_CPA10g01007 [Acorus calamus]|uniref:Uncharacterized protein n=1 Tax=Acorus calamus TaxID=4465 RepID=A0AAV9DX76_ACOCL|nr:hypothetical protein QJS10_CPA10g01007 [Acorus calamus]
MNQHSFSLLETDRTFIVHANIGRMVRRLRIQQRIKNAELGILNDRQENDLPDFPSFIPFLPPLTTENLKLYYASCFSLIAGIIIFGGLLAPTEIIFCTAYIVFIYILVDPIVASFSGGAVGVISALMVVEINNVKQQEHKRCKYCLGTGYLACARCSSTGSLVLIEPVATLNSGDQPLSPPTTERCSNCSGSGKRFTIYFTLEDKRFEVHELMTAKD